MTKKKPPGDNEENQPPAPDNPLYNSNPEMVEKARQRIFDQMGEFSNGSYCVFFLDEENRPQVYASFGSDIQAMGMVTFINAWSGIVQQAHAGSIMSCMTGEDEDGEEA